MQAIQGIYDNGRLKLDSAPPMSKARVIVTFTEELVAEQGMSNEEALRILRKFKGCIDRDFDYEKERDEYLNEKYGPFN